MRLLYLFAIITRQYLARTSGKEMINIFFNIIQPIPALVICACDNDIEHSPVKIGDAAETEDTIFPDCFQRIAKNIFLPF